MHSGNFLNNPYSISKNGILYFFVRNELAETRLEIAAITGGEFDEDEEGEGEEAELQRQIL